MKTFNIQVVGGSSLWTGLSALECGNTLTALAGDQHPIWGRDRLRRRFRGRYRLGHLPVVFSAGRRLNVQSGLRKGLVYVKTLFGSSVVIRERGY